MRNLASTFGSSRAIALAIVVVLVWVRAIDPTAIEVIRHRIFDFYQKFYPRIYVPQPVAIIDIDEKSLTRYGQWPWPRTLVADLVDKLKAQGVASTGFDIVFAEPDRMSPETYAKGMPGLSETARNELANLPDNDTVLARAIAGSRIVLGETGIHQVGEQRDISFIPETPVATLGGDPRPFLIKYPGILGNLPVLEKAALGRGLFSISPDQDGIVRRVPLVAMAGERLQPSLSIETLRVATGQDAIAIKRDEAGIRSVVVAGVEIATDRNAQLWVYYTDHEPRRFVSAADVLDGTVPPGRLNGHLTLVGTSAVGLYDLRSTPLNPVMPGVEVHAQVMETILGKTQLTRPHYAAGVEIITAVLASLFVIAFLPMLGALPVLIMGAIGASGIAAGAWWFFTQHLMLFDAVFPLVTSAAAFMVIAFMNYRREELKRSQIRAAFGQYLAPALVESLSKDSSRLSLGGERKNMTILFSDVRGFTALSEGFKNDPHGLIQLMNGLLTPLTNVIIARNGTIDKYMGDAIMAFWNAPLDVADHPAEAAAAALAMQVAMGEVNTKAQAAAELEGRKIGKLSIGVGLNTGDCVVGNMGSARRFDYSVLGDAVNLASRLEGQTKSYGVNIIVGNATAKEISDRFALIPLDLVRVKGKKQPEQIFALLGDETLLKSPEFGQLSALAASVLAAFRRQNWDEALQLMDSGQSMAKSLALDGYFAVLTERIELYRKVPPPKDWDGVYEALSK